MTGIKGKDDQVNIIEIDLSEETEGIINEITKVMDFGHPEDSKRDTVLTHLLLIGMLAHGNDNASAYALLNKITESAKAHHTLFSLLPKIGG